LCCSSPAVFDSRSLTLVEGLRVADPGSVSGIVLMHPKGGGVNFWTGTDILLWPAEYNVTLRIRVDSTVSGPLVTVSEVVWPFVTHVQGEDASGAGHAVSVTEEPEPCNITLSATVVNPGTLPASLGYTDVTIQFRADVFGLYRFPGTWPTSGANLYLDRVTLRPAAPLGYYRALSCP
jgi:hypothetical protein